MKIIRIRPKFAFKNFGGAFGIVMNPKRIYRAIPATNQPDYKEKGLVFITVKQKRGKDEFLLSKEDYVVVKKKLKKVM